MRGEQSSLGVCRPSDTGHPLPPRPGGRPQSTSCGLRYGDFPDSNGRKVYLLELFSLKCIREREVPRVARSWARILRIADGHVDDLTRNWDLCRYDETNVDLRPLWSGARVCPPSFKSVGSILSYRPYPHLEVAVGNTLDVLVITAEGPDRRDEVNVISCVHNKWSRPVLLLGIDDPERLIFVPCEPPKIVVMREAFSRTPGDYASSVGHGNISGASVRRLFEQGHVFVPETEERKAGSRIPLPITMNPTRMHTAIEL
jgi:hypothetical protein